MELAAKHKIKSVAWRTGEVMSFWADMPFFLQENWWIVCVDAAGKAMAEWNAHANAADERFEEARCVDEGGAYNDAVWTEGLFVWNTKLFFPAEGPSQRAPFHCKNEKQVETVLYHLLFTTSLPTLLQFEDRNNYGILVLSHAFRSWIWTCGVCFLWMTKIWFIMERRRAFSVHRENSPRRRSRGKGQKVLWHPVKLKWFAWSVEVLLDADF